MKSGEKIKEQKGRTKEKDKAPPENSHNDNHHNP